MSVSAHGSLRYLYGGQINRCRLYSLKVYSHFASFWTDICESIIDVCDCIHCQVLGVKIACVDSPSCRQSLTNMGIYPLPSLSARNLPIHEVNHALVVAGVLQVHRRWGKLGLELIWEDFVAISSSQSTVNENRSERDRQYQTQNTRPRHLGCVDDEAYETCKMDHLLS